MKRMRDIFIAWKNLAPDEETERRLWARQNYQIGSSINGHWHPVVQDECVKMNFEYVDKGINIEQQDDISNES